MSVVNDTPFSEAELRALLERDEGQFLEFKSLWDLSTGTRRLLERRKARELVAEAVAAFANADGGTLLLGMEDDGTPSGHAYAGDAVADLLAVPERRLRPAVRCRSQRITVNNHEVIVFQVPLAPEAVMVDGTGFPYRVGDRILREPQETINARKEAYRRVGYEQRIRTEATLEDLDLDLARRFLSRTALRERHIEDLLVYYGLVHPRPGGWAVTNAALLLFARAPALRWHPRAGIRFFRVAGRERRHGAERNVTQLGRVDPPLASALVEAHRVAREHIRRSERLHDLFFREVPEYPEFAWQETLVNALAHRDYEDQSREIEVWFFEDRMEVKSPGELLSPVTLDVLRQRRPAHATRNPVVVRVLADAGFMRDEGEGIPRIFDEMEASFLRAPDLDVDAGEFRAVLHNEPIFTGPSAEWQSIVDRLPISTAQKRALLAHPEGFTNEDYRRLYVVDWDEAYRQIQELVSLGVVAGAQGPARGAIYRVSAHLRETRAFLERRLPELRTFLGRHPFLKNADYREMFGVTRLKAVRELAALVESRHLVLEGRGRGARYLRGPELAAAGEK